MEMMLISQAERGASVDMWESDSSPQLGCGRMGIVGCGLLQFYACCFWVSDGSGVALWRESRVEGSSSHRWAH